MGYRKPLLLWGVQPRQYRRQCGLTATREIKQGDMERQTMGAKESPRFESGTPCGKEVWEGEWPGPG